MKRTLLGLTAAGLLMGISTAANAAPLSPGALSKYAANGSSAVQQVHFRRHHHRHHRRYYGYGYGIPFVSLGFGGHHHGHHGHGGFGFGGHGGHHGGFGHGGFGHGGGHHGHH